MEFDEERGMRLTECPRCAFQSYETLGTHGHCLECLYSTEISRRDYYSQADALIPLWALAAIRGVQKSFLGSQEAVVPA